MFDQKVEVEILEGNELPLKVQRISSGTNIKQKDKQKRKKKYLSLNGHGN
jgi:hypothetical protein